jgi:hypothetical protein
MGLGEVVRGAEEVVAGLEAGVFHARDAASMVAEFARLENLATAGRALCAARVASTRVWAEDGDTSAQGWLARTSGTSRRAAGELLEVAGRLATLPEVSDAFRRGELSSEQAAVVADAASAAPQAQGELVAAAGSVSLPELRDRARRIKHAAAGDSAEQRHRRVHQRRHLRMWSDADGAGRGAWSVTPEVQAEIDLALAPIRDRLRDEARAAGRRQPDEATAADALAELARRHLPTSTADNDSDSDTEGEGGGASDGDGGSVGRRSARSLGSRAKVIVTVSHAALVRGHVEGDEVCEIAGIGPVPVSWALELIESDAFLAAVVTDGIDIRSVVHLGRSATVLQRTALQAMGPVCSVQGCGARARLEIDHRVEWATSAHTTLDELDLLCPRHHLRKTLDGYHLAPGRGVRPFLAPADQPTSGPAGTDGDTQDRPVGRDRRHRSPTPSRTASTTGPTLFDTG